VRIFATALGGVTRMHGVIGTSDGCIATNPSNLAVALTAVDAVLHVQGRAGAERAIPIADFYELPGTTPWRENVLEPGDLIIAVEIPASAVAAESAIDGMRGLGENAFKIELAQRAVVRALQMVAGTSTRIWAKCAWRVSRGHLPAGGFSMQRRPVASSSAA